MKNMWVKASVLAISFFLFGTDAHGQFFPLGSGGGEDEKPRAPAINLVTGDPCKIVAHDSEVLSDHQHRFDAASDEFVHMRQQKESYTKRLDQISALLNELKTKKTDDLESAAGHERKEEVININAADSGTEATLPSPVTALKKLARALRLAIDRIEQVEDLLSEERQSLSVGFEKIETLITKCDRKLRTDRTKEQEKRESISLFQTLSMSRDLYLAELDLSLARSRQRSYDVGDEILNPLYPANEKLLDAGPAETSEPFNEQRNTILVENREIEEEASIVAESITGLERKHRLWMRMATKTWETVARLDVYIKKASVDELEKELEAAVSRVVVTSEDVKQEKVRARLEQEKIDNRIKKLAKERATLLGEFSGAHLVERGEISVAYEKEITRVELKEMILLLELEKAHSGFVEGAYETLFLLQEGKSPPTGFFEEHKQILDKLLLEERIKGISKGREAWRRQRSQLAERQVPPEQLEIKEKVLHVLDQVTSQCAKQEEVLESSGRLASIVRAHLSRYSSTSRSFWWYLGCSVLSLLFLAVAVVLSALLNRGMLMLSKKSIDLIHSRLERATAIKTESLNQKLRKLVRYTFFIIYVLGIIAVWLGTTMLCLQFVWNMEWQIAQLPAMMGASLFMIGEASITLADILKLIAILVLTIIGTRLLQGFLRYQVFHFFEWDSGVKHAVAVVLRYIMLFIGFSIGLEYLEVGLEVFAVFLGVIGIGIGFGLQKLAANYVSGFVILFSRPVKKGDFITAANDLEGEIMQVGMRTTTVRTRDNISVILPNTDIVSEKVINWSYGDSLIRLRVPIGVAYGSDIDKVEAVLLDMAGAHPDVLHTPAPRVWFTAFGESSLDFELLVWVSNITNRFVIVSDLNKAIDRGFRDNNVTVPFPQRDVHIKSTRSERIKTKDHEEK